MDEQPIKLNSISCHSSSTDMEMDEVAGCSEISSISTLLRKHVLNQNELNSKIMNIENELLKISQLDREVVSQMRSQSSMQFHLCRGEKTSNELAAEAGMDCTRQDLDELKQQINKLSSMISPKCQKVLKQNLRSTTPSPSQEQQEISENCVQATSITDLSFNSANCCAEEDSLKPVMFVKQNSANETCPKEFKDSVGKTQPTNAGLIKEALREKITSRLAAELTGKKMAGKKSRTRVCINSVGRTELVPDCELTMKKMAEKKSRNKMCMRSVRPKELTPECVKRLREKYFPAHSTSEECQRLARCTLCHKIMDKVSLQEHLKTHKRPKSYACAVCNQAFHLSHHLAKHMRSHPEFRPYKCTQCFKTYTSPYGLKQHMLYHSGQRPHMCSICGNTFWHLTHLKVHTMIHTGEAPYKCPECPRRFKTRSTMRKHRAVHSNDRPILCSECGKTFKLPQGLRQHMHKVHLNKDSDKMNPPPLEQPIAEESIPHTYHYKANSHPVQPAKVAEAVVHNYHYKPNPPQMEPSKMEDTAQQAYFEQTYLRFTEMSNRNPNLFIPPDNAPFSSFHSPQTATRAFHMPPTSGREQNVFDKWE